MSTQEEKKSIDDYTCLIEGMGHILTHIDTPLENTWRDLKILQQFDIWENNDDLLAVIRGQKDNERNYPQSVLRHAFYRSYYCDYINLSMKTVIEALDKHPDNPDFWLILGEFCEKYGEGFFMPDSQYILEDVQNEKRDGRCPTIFLQQAEYAYKKAAELAPDSYKHQMACGLYLFQQYNWRKVRESGGYFHAAMEIEPDNYRPHMYSASASCDDGLTYYDGSSASYYAEMAIELARQKGAREANECAIFLKNNVYLWSNKPAFLSL